MATKKVKVSAPKGPQPGVKKKRTTAVKPIKKGY